MNQVQVLYHRIGQALSLLITPFLWIKSLSLLPPSPGLPRK